MLPALHGLLREEHRDYQLSVGRRQAVVAFQSRWSSLPFQSDDSRLQWWRTAHYDNSDSAGRYLHVERRKWTSGWGHCHSSGNLGFGYLLIQSHSCWQVFNYFCYFTIADYFSFCLPFGEYRWILIFLVFTWLLNRSWRHFVFVPPVWKLWHVSWMMDLTTDDTFWPVLGQNVVVIWLNPSIHSFIHSFIHSKQEIQNTWRRCVLRPCSFLVSGLHWCMCKLLLSFLQISFHELRIGYMDKQTAQTLYAAS